jgi:hypothetical protein
MVEPPGCGIWIDPQLVLQRQRAAPVLLHRAVPPAGSGIVAHEGAVRGFEGGGNSAAVDDGARVAAHDGVGRDRFDEVGPDSWLRLAAPPRQQPRITLFVSQAPSTGYSFRDAMWHGPLQVMQRAMALAWCPMSCYTEIYRL